MGLFSLKFTSVKLIVSVSPSSDRTITCPCLCSQRYRLAPKYHFPAQFEDVYKVLKFVLQNNILAQYGVDPSRISVAGDSSGGNLAAAVAQEVGYLYFTGLETLFC